jgi:hypothetical protein
VRTRIEQNIGPKKEKVYEKLYNLYSSPNIVREIKSVRMRWARHVEHIRKM